MRFVDSRIGNALSGPTSLSKGVHQGSVLVWAKAGMSELSHELRQDYVKIAISGFVSPIWDADSATLLQTERKLESIIEDGWKLCIAFVSFHLCPFFSISKFLFVSFTTICYFIYNTLLLTTFQFPW